MILFRVANIAHNFDKPVFHDPAIARRWKSRPCSGGLLLRGGVKNSPSKVVSFQMTGRPGVLTVEVYVAGFYTAVYSPRIISIFQCCRSY